jgi:hypothetical protein
VGPFDVHQIRVQVCTAKNAVISKRVSFNLRPLEEKDWRPSALRLALTKGEKSDPSTPFDFEAFICGKRSTEAPAQ